MKWTSYSDYNREQRKQNKRSLRSVWHRHFALCPCRVGWDGKTGAPIMVWLQWIERRQRYHKCHFYAGDFYGSWTENEYRLKEV